MAKRQLEVMSCFDVPQEDPEGFMRRRTLVSIRKEVEYEMEIRAAFEQTRRDVAAGKKVPFTDPYAGAWELHSSQYLKEWLVDIIDQRDWKYEFEECTGLNFKKCDDYPQWVICIPGYNGSH
jgi:hypothetical protein